MAVIIFSLALSALCELVMYECRGRLRLRTIVALLSLIVTVSVTVLIVLIQPNAFTALLAVLSAYRVFNIGRLLKARMHEQYLQHVTYRTGLWLIGGQALSLGASYVWVQQHISFAAVLLGATILQIICAAISLLTIHGHARRSRLPTELPVATDAQLPSISVVIPARNESEDLAQCISTLLASHYPKLEIIVLDDCSQSTRTPDIIKSFAHDGVRFIQGTEPDDTWLAKNQAYDTLSQAASGEYIVFCGVDVRYAAFTLRRLMAYMLDNKQDMVCVMPQNVPSSSGVSAPVLVQPMRYVWELALPRRWTNRPPVLSTCWVINRRVLLDLGGFKAAPRMIIPEAYFARRLAQRGSYSFITSSKTLGLVSAKNGDEQRQTAVRVAYPQLHRRPEVVAIVTLSLLAWLALPTITLLRASASEHAALLTIGAATVVVLSYVVYGRIINMAYGLNKQLLSVMVLPLALIWQIFLLQYSMYKYEFSRVVWKDRNVCIPVMHVVSHLPKT